MKSSMNIYRGRTHTEVYLASILYDSIEDQDYSSVTTLLKEKKADPNIVLPRRGISPFHLAIGSDSADFAIKVVMLIIQHNGNPNVTSDEGLTPVHIAAAWGRTEILQLLLNCGGDPELTDNCYKSALHYAIEEQWDEAVTHIKDFISYQRSFLVSDFCSKIPYNMTLDKIHVNNGVIIGEYEVAKNEKETNPVIDLTKLPQTNSTDYVLNWCNSQSLNEDVHSFEELEPCAFHNMSQSSPSSQESMMKSRNFVNVNIRRRGRKVNDSIISYDKNKFCDKRFDYVPRNICAYKESSRESGILTLPESCNDDKSIDDYFEYMLLNTDSDTSTNNRNRSKDLEDIENKKNLENRIREVMDVQKSKSDENKTDKSKDTSSDYCTCTDGSEGANILEQNIYEMSSSISTRSMKFLKSNSSSTDQDLSFVSVSEIYKYTDVEEGVILYEKRLLPSVVGSQNETSTTDLSQSSKLSSLPKSFDYDTDTLRRELTIQGFDPGPITKTTKRIYLRKLYQLRKYPEVVENNVSNKKVYSNEIQKSINNPGWLSDLAVFCKLENEMTKDFLNPDPTRRWREGLNKSSFTYLLLDPRITQNLPCRAEKLSQNDIWETFLSSIFYVGKGKRTRPYSHLYDALTHFNKGSVSATNRKLNRILDIWKDGHGVICLHVFQNVIPVEAYTREALMINTLKIDNVTNIKAGDFYGVAATWSSHQKNSLGLYLLHKAMTIFLNEGERQLSPSDID